MSQKEVIRIACKIPSNCLSQHFSSSHAYRVSGKALLDTSLFSLILVFLSIWEFYPYILDRHHHTSQGTSVPQ